MSSITRNQWTLSHADGRVIAITHAIRDGSDVIGWVELDDQDRLMRKGTVEFTPLSRLTPENEAAGLRHRFYGEGFRSKTLAEEILRAIDVDNPPAQDPGDIDGLRTEEEVYDDAERHDVESRLREEQEAELEAESREVSAGARKYVDRLLENAT